MRWYSSKYKINDKGQSVLKDTSNTNINDSPAKRYGHTMNAYSDYLVMFGGCGAYSDKTKLHESFKDVRIYDIKKADWLKYEFNSSHGFLKNYDPEKRMFHASAVFGPFLFVHGGYNDDEKEVFDDMHLYDIENRRWMCIMQPNTSKKQTIGKRFMHTITRVVSSKIDLKTIESMSILTQNYKSKLSAEAITADKMGLYAFGGMNENRQPTNDLYHIKSCNRENSEIYDIKKGEYNEGVEPKVYFEVKKITAEGTPPPPRCLHVAEHVGKYLYIFGGRNPSLFKQIQNTALNDIHLFDIEKRAWTTIALYGYLPQSIWGHSSTVYDSKIIIFGGKNLDRYAHGNRLYVIHTHHCESKIKETKNHVKQLRNFARDRYKTVV